MKITLNELKKIIAEEVQKTLSEAGKFDDDVVADEARGLAEYKNFIKFISEVADDAGLSKFASAVGVETSPAADAMEGAWMQYTGERSYLKNDEEKVDHFISSVRDAVESAGAVNLASKLEDALNLAKGEIVSRVINFAS